MKSACVHALEHDQMAARIGDRDRDRDSSLLGLSDGRFGYFFRPGVRQALGVRDIHESTSLEWAMATRRTWHSAPGAVRQQGPRCAAQGIPASNPAAKKC